MAFLTEKSTGLFRLLLFFFDLDFSLFAFLGSVDGGDGRQLSPNLSQQNCQIDEKIVVFRESRSCLEKRDANLLF